jgi:hypothetical protein
VRPTVPIIIPTNPPILPTIKPTSIRKQTNLPTFTPTVGNISETTNNTMEFLPILCTQSGEYGGIDGKYQYFIMNDGEYYFNRGDYSLNIYIPYPAKENMNIYIKNFQSDYDIIDLTLFPKFSKLQDLSYSTNPLTFLLLTNQMIILSNIQEMNQLSEKNFFFLPATSTKTENASNSQAALIGAGIFVFFFVFLVLRDTFLPPKKKTSSNKIRAMNSNSNINYVRHDDSHAEDDVESRPEQPIRNLLPVIHEEENDENGSWNDDAYYSYGDSDQDHNDYVDNSSDRYENDHDYCDNVDNHPMNYFHDYPSYYYPPPQHRPIIIRPYSESVVGANNDDDDGGGTSDSSVHPPGNDLLRDDASSAGEDRPISSTLSSDDDDGDDNEIYSALNRIEEVGNEVQSHSDDQSWDFSSMSSNEENNPF